MILVILFILLVIFPFGFLLLIHKSEIKNRQKRKPDKILKNKTDLFYLHQVSRVWVGMIVELEDTKSKYILTSVDFDSTDSWDLWKPYTDLNEPYIKPKLITLYNSNNTPYVLDKNHLLIISNDEFDNKNVRKGNVISLNIAKIPKVNDIVIDIDLVLWQVKSINDYDIYTLVKKDNYKKEKLVNIYAVGECLWQL